MSAKCSMKIVIGGIVVAGEKKRSHGRDMRNRKPGDDRPRTSSCALLRSCEVVNRHMKWDTQIRMGHESRLPRKIMGDGHREMWQDATQRKYWRQEPS